MRVGARILFKSRYTPGGVSLGVALSVTLPFALIAVFLMRLVLSSQTWKPSTGAEQLADTSGEAAEVFLQHAGSQSFQGMVRLRGELWRAVAREEIPAGAKVRVTRVEGLTLHVEPGGKSPANQ